MVTFTVGEFVFGMATCYDLRFPELFRLLVKKGRMFCCCLLPLPWKQEETTGSFCSGPGLLKINAGWLPQGNGDNSWKDGKPLAEAW